MPLPRILRRLAWLWAGVLAVTLGLLGLAVFAPSAVAPPHGGDVPAVAPTVTLTDPSGTVTVFDVELARTPEEQQVGLMNRPVVEKGMLFVFDGDQYRSFWMKNTLVPLDISFFDSTGAWVSSTRMEPCVEEPCAIYPSAKPAMYALELPVGGVGPRIGDGWKMTWKPGA